MKTPELKPRRDGRVRSSELVSLRRKCKCELCTKWSPLIRRIQKKLRGKDAKLFDEYVMMEWQQSDDLGAAEAKLAGEWPGWEWMKEAIEEQKRKQANAQAERRAC